MKEQRNICVNCGTHKVGIHCFDCIGTSIRDAEIIRKQVVKEMDTHYTDSVWRASEAREKNWNRDYSSLDNYLLSVNSNRINLINLMGGITLDMVSSPVFQKLESFDGITVQRVWLPLNNGIRVYGILLIPQHPIGPKPAVIAQHGFGGSPEATVGYNLEEKTQYLNEFGLQLARRGYVVFAPLMMNNTPDSSRLNRKGTLIGKQLMGLEIGMTVKVVDFLETLPQVNSDRIGYMGISQGGMMGLWVGAVEQRIVATVCSGFFTKRTPKMIELSPGYTAFMETGDDNKFFWGQLNEFSDSDIASLICPRAFFVEAGTEDTCFSMDHVKDEFAQVKDVYDKLGIPEKAELGIFKGPHQIHGVESFQFLDKWLK